MLNLYDLLFYHLSEKEERREIEEFYSGSPVHSDTMLPLMIMMMMISMRDEKEILPLSIM